jgi:uncharacterized membrane protein YjjP (DUF1212 family)
MPEGFQQYSTPTRFDRIFSQKLTWQRLLPLLAAGYAVIAFTTYLALDNTLFFFTGRQENAMSLIIIALWLASPLFATAIIAAVCACLIPYMK